MGVSRALPFFFLLLLCAVACGAVPSSDEGETVAFSLEGDLAPGEEKTLCRYVRMPAAQPGDAEVFVRGGRHALSEGGHHYLLYRTTKTAWTDDMGATVPCGEHDGVLGNVTTYVTGGQTREANADFPAAAALAFRPGEILLLQGHFLNAAASPRRASVHLELRTMAASAVEHRAGVLRFYDPFIVVPPRGKARAGMTCTIARDVTLLSAAAHMHARGRGYAAYVDPPDGPPSATPFYTTKDGQHPTFFAGYLPVRAGSKIRFECDYESNDDRAVTQGPSAERDEMCMFNAFYFPAMAPGDEACEDMHGHGTGGASCAATTACLEQCPVSDRPHFERNDPTVGECWQRCITQSCPNVTAKLFPQLACTAKKCEAECAAMGEACRACVRERCAPELEACQSLACDR
jgi:hypothetical protein